MIEKMKETLYEAIRDQKHQEVHGILIEYPELINEVIDKHCDKEFQEGFTALLLALAFSDIPMVKMILEKFDADPNIGRNRNFTALFKLSGSTKEDKKELVDILLKQGADVNVQLESGKTPLMLASQTGYLYMVKKLLLHDANASIKDRNNKNALAWMGHYSGEEDEMLINEIIRLLVEHGADLYCVDAFEDTPLSLAREYNEPLVEKALLKYMKLYPENDNSETR